MSFESALAFLIAIFIFCITPGPGILALLARAMRLGVTACLGLMLGMVVSDLIYLTFACIGLAQIAENYHSAFVVIRYAGAAYLIYLGYKTFSASVKSLSVDEDVAAEKTTRFGWDAFLQGFLISLSNPKVVLFYIAFLPTFLDVTVLTGWDIVVVNILAIIGLMAGGLLVAVLSSRLSRMFTSRRSQQYLNGTAGGIMISAGVVLALKG